MRERVELGCVAWTAGVVALWVSRHLPLLDRDALWPGGMGALLAGPRVALPPLALLPLAFALFAGWTLAGRRALRAWGPASLGPLEELAFAAGLGLGTGATLLAALALVGALNPVAMLATSLAWAGVALIPGGAPPAHAAAGVGWPARAALDAPLAVTCAAAALALGTALAHALVPPWQPDSLYYQLTLPKLYLQAGGFAFLPQEPVVSAYPGLGQMLFALALAAGRDDLAALASWAHVPVLLLATYALARRTSTDRSALTAAAVLACVPQLAFVASVALVDVITAAHLTLAAHAALRAWDTPADRARWTCLAALAMGFAVANKYLALPAAALLALALLVTAWRGDRARAALAIALIALVPCAPWMMKNARDWGSPLFPFHVPASVAENVREVVRGHQQGFASNGGATPLPLLPFDVTFSSDPNDIDRYQGEVGPLLLALLPVPLLALGGPRSPRAALALYALAQFLFWSAATRQVRFLFPLLPPYLAAWLPASLPRPLATALAAGAVCAALWTVGFIRPGNDLGYLAGRESRASYYRSMSATAGLFQACAALEHEPPGRVILFWEYRGYLVPRPFLPEHTYWLQRLPTDPGALLSRLQSEGVSHLLLNRTIWEENRAPWPFAPALEGLLRLPGVQRVPLPDTPPPHVELWRLPVAPPHR